MALDYNDPVVGEELAKIQPMTFEEVEEELMEQGIPAPPMMNDMDLKLMLVELRLRNTGRMKGDKPVPKPTSFSSKFEEAMYTKPVFADLFNEFKKMSDHNSQNVASEYLNDRENAVKRYGKDYKDLIAQIEAALNKKPEVTSPKVTFSGFPANMGEAGCKMTLEALGEIVDFECVESEDLPILTGKVEFEDVETAKKAIDQYDGMDMGMGTTLELVSV